MKTKWGQKVFKNWKDKRLIINDITKYDFRDFESLNDTAEAISTVKQCSEFYGAFE